MAKVYPILLAICVLFISCAKPGARVNAPSLVNAPGPDDDWMSTLPVPPGASLKAKRADRREKQVITFFQVTEMRAIEGRVFISGTGYGEINGGGTIFAGMNRALDPFIEATITDPKSAAFGECRTMLDKKNLVESAVALSGNGYFAPMPGIGERRLAVLRLDTTLSCKLVPRR